jgi:FkbM family methyltransferase
MCRSGARVTARLLSPSMGWLGRLVRDFVGHLPGGRRLRAELEQSRRQRDVLHERLKRSERQRDVLRRRLDIRRQRALAMQPDEAVLEHILPLRHAAMLAANHDGRETRESAFAARSVSYSDALANADQTPAPAERVVLAGLTWWVPLEADDTEGIAHRLGARRRLPLAEILATRELAVGRAMIDIGANVGTTSIPRALLGDFNWVYAIEPDPLNYACLVQNIVSNGVRGLVLPDRVAIGDSNGEMTMHVRRSGTHHLVTRAEHVNENERMGVPCLTLDTWVDRIGIELSDVGFIKSDTQGWDARVLTGAQRVLARRHIAWQIEFSPPMLERSGTSVDEVFALLERHFTHFIDLRREAGARVRGTQELRASLEEVGSARRRYTNLLLYNASR